MGRSSASTRRQFVKTSTGLAVGGALAGCADNSDSDADAGSGSYSVTMAPTGKVGFDKVPETWVPYGGDYADMGVALGQADSLAGIGQSGEYYTAPYSELPDVSVNKSEISKNDLVEAEMSKELFYSLDSDVHVIDPEMLRNWFDWSDGDVTEISNNVAPFLGNMIFRRSDSWHDYRYYTLYQAFEKMAELFQEQERYRAFKSLHDDFIADLQSELPPADERPTVFLTYEGTDKPETFSPYRLNDNGTSKKQWNDLGVSDALSGTGVENLSTENRNELDYENLLTIDPDVLLVRGHEDKSATEFRNVVLEYMRDHPVGNELTAVQNGRVYRGGYLRQGPIHNLFLTERATKQLYPDTFGPVTSDEQLFDRQKVADIINGEI